MTTAWQTFFDDDYLRFWSPVLGPERAAAETAGIAALLASLGPTRLRVLDVCGGSGRIARPLAAHAGHDVTIADISRPLLAHAGPNGTVSAEAATALGLSPADRSGELWRVRADVRALPFAASYDAAICIFTSLGILPEESDHMASLASIATSLRPGGLFVLELAHRDYAASLGPRRTWYELGDGQRLLRSFDFDPLTGRTDEWLEPEGEPERRKAWSVRLFTATELDRMLRALRLQPLAWFGDFAEVADWDFEPRLEFDPRSPRLVVVARAITEGNTTLGTTEPTTWNDLVSVLVCPATKEPLTEVTDDELATLNENLASGGLKTVSGETALGPLTGALERADGALVYPVRDGVPDLFSGNAILLDPETESDA